MAKTKITNREAQIAEMQARLDQAKKDIAYLREVNRRIKQIDKNALVLDNYYSNDWLDDYNHAKVKGSYPILNQDSLFDGLQEIYEEKIKMLKYITSKLK